MKQRKDWHLKDIETACESAYTLFGENVASGLMKAWLVCPKDREFNTSGILKSLADTEQVSLPNTATPSKEREIIGYTHGNDKICSEKGPLIALAILYSLGMGVLGGMAGYFQGSRVNHPYTGAVAGVLLSTTPLAMALVMAYKKRDRKVEMSL